MKKRMALLCLLLLLVCAAWAEPAAEELPAEITAYLESAYMGCAVKGYLEVEVPGDARYAIAVAEDAWYIFIFKQTDGAWEYWSSDYMNGAVESLAWINAGEDAGMYGDALGFHAVLKNGAIYTYGWNGEQFQLIGWRDPAQYDGTVVVRGTALSYYPLSLDEPEYTVDVGDPLRWITGLELPATPQIARSWAAILPDAVAEAYPGYTMASYVNDGSSAEAQYVRVENGCLYLKSVAFSAEKGASARDLMPLPLSADMQAQTPDAIVHFVYNIALAPEGLDAARLGVADRIMDGLLQTEQLILLTEDGQGDRRAVIVTQDVEDGYHAQATPALPPDSALDTYHPGDNNISFYFENQSWEAGYQKRSDGSWGLDWVMGDNISYSVTRYGVSSWSPDDTVKLVGTLENADLFDCDFSAIPRTEEALRRSVDAAGWAMVHNPDPADRLNLRTTPSRSAESYGKFYNGTPVRVLETRGDWCKVQIGEGGLTGWMVKQYLAFGEAANGVERVSPDVTLREEYEDQPLICWADRTRRAERILDKSEDWQIIGVADDLYILLGLHSGDILYAPMSAYWEGNG